MKREKNGQLKEYHRDVNFWKSFKPKIKFVNESDKINKIYRISKLSIFFYNSTGVLELISLNKPVILILNSNQWFNIPKKVLYYYEDLCNAGIIYKDIKSAAVAINKISKDTNKWWYNQKRQKILSKFRKNFAQYAEDLDKKFIKIIKNIENDY